MTPSEELEKLDAEWDTIASSVAKGSTYGHTSERRLGQRMPAACWALLRDGELGVYARTVELSATGAVLELVCGRSIRFDAAHPLALDLFVPGTSRPLHATAKPARAIGDLEAFELSAMNAADRLTLAEHLDHLALAHPKTPPALERARASVPPAWGDFVRALKARPANGIARAQRF